MSVFRCTFRLELDREQGPGYGLLIAHSSEAGALSADAGWQLMIRNPSTGACLGSSGWQPSDTRLTPAAIRNAGDDLLLPLGPACINNLELQAIYKLSLFGGADVLEGALIVSELAYSRDASLLSPVAAPPLELVPTPAPAPEPIVEAPLPEEAPVQEEPESLPDLPTAPARKSSLPLILGILLVLVLLGGGAFWYLHRDAGPADAVLPGTNSTAPATEASPAPSAAPSTTPAPAASPETSASDPKSGPQSASPEAQPPAVSPETPAPGAVQQPGSPSAAPAATSGLGRAREALRNKVAPAEAFALARELMALSDAQAQDGAFLLLDAVESSGNAEAALLLGDFYAPGMPSRGTIAKDPEMARRYYQKALDAGSSEAKQRLDQLR